MKGNESKKNQRVSLSFSWLRVFHIGLELILFMSILSFPLLFFGYLPWQASQAKVIFKQISPSCLLEIKRFMNYHGVHVVCLESNSISFTRNGYRIERKVSLSTFSSPEVFNAK